MTSDDEDPGSGVGTDDAAGPALDLSPRTTGPAPARKRRGANPVVWVVLGLIVVAIGFVVFQGLSSATLYFRNVDEALEQRDDLGTRQFRLQGLVTSVDETDGQVTFIVTFNDASIPVHASAGDLPPQFELGEPVVMEGHFADQDEPLFLADRVLVKHDEAYEADYGDRVSDADDGETDGDTGGG